MKRDMFQTAFCVAVVSLALVGCKKKEPPKDTTKAPAKQAVKPTPDSPPAKKPSNAPDPRVTKVQKTLKSLKMNLKKELMAGLEEGGLTRAVEACKLKAPEIVKLLETAKVKVGRVSRKPRNPKNAVQPWLEPLVKHFENKKPKPGAYKIVKLEEGYGYVEPIFVKPLCLSCHGKSVDKNVAAMLKKHYPKDKATGYVAGDFRGLFWVKVSE
jgi:hypothetical protein